MLCLLLRQMKQPMALLPNGVCIAAHIEGILIIFNGVLDSIMYNQLRNQRVAL